jgi:glycosyltransferase involved in cell wall biosynthesis
MNILFFIGDADWTARARIFATAAHGLAARDHQVTVACPGGPILDRLDTKRIGIVRIDPCANAAVGTFDLRRVTQERSLDVAFVHTAREQFLVGSGMRFGKSGAVHRRVGMFEPADAARGMFTARMAPARLMVSTAAEAIANPGATVVPLGIDPLAADAVAPRERRALHLRDDAIVVACPYAPNGRVRLLNILRTLALVAPRHPKLRAVVYGHRATDDDLRMQAAALGVAPLVQFVDGNAGDTMSIVRTSEFVWIAGAHDAAALGCLDAMAAGKPVIAERSAVTQYFVADGINGTVLPEGDPQTLAAAVADVMARPETREKFGAAGRARAQREFPLNEMVDGFERAATGEGAAQPAGR